MAESNILDTCHQFSFYDFHHASLVSFKQFVCRWTIKEFSKIPSGKDLVSADFKPLPTCDWNLILKKTQEQLCVYLVNKSDKKFKLEYVVSLLDLNDKIWKRRTETEVLGNEKLEILKDDSDIFVDSNFLTNDTLILVCDFKIHGIVIARSSSTKWSMLNTSPVYNGSEKLIVDLKNLMDHPSCDVVLIADGGRLRAHALILCARSPIFEKMLMYQTYERGHSIKTNMKFSVLKNLVEFLYCGATDIEMDFESITTLYAAADKFQVLDLRNMCATSILAKLTVNNVFRILHFAMKKKDDYMKMTLYNFIIEEFDAITETDGWKEFLCHSTETVSETLKHCFNLLKLNWVADSKTA